MAEQLKAFFKGPAVAAWTQARQNVCACELLSLVTSSFYNAVTQ